VELSSQSAAAHHNLGLALEKSGDLSSALREISLAYQLDPNRPGLEADFERLRNSVKP